MSLILHIVELITYTYTPDEYEDECLNVYKMDTLDLIIATLKTQPHPQFLAEKENQDEMIKSLLSALMY